MAQTLIFAILAVPEKGNLYILKRVNLSKFKDIL